MEKRNRRFRYAANGVPYHRQGLIWFTARCYNDQPEQVRALIQSACRQAGGDNAQALFAYVTTGRSMVAIMQDYFIASDTTMYRMINRWYRIMDRELGRENGGGR